MKDIQKLLFLLALIWLLGSQGLKANSESPDALLHGYVTDAITKKPVSGVVVSITAPGVTGSKEVTTNADGYFSFEQLPARQVNLQFGKKGYQVYKRANVAVNEKTAIKIAVEFLPKSMEDDSDNADCPLLHILRLD